MAQRFLTRRGQDQALSPVSERLSYALGRILIMDGCKITEHPPALSIREDAGSITENLARFFFYTRTTVLMVIRAILRANSRIF